MMDQPFVCLDNEAEMNVNLALIERLSTDVIVTTSTESERLNIVLQLHDEFELWGIKIQLWVTGKFSIFFYNHLSS